MATDEKSTLEPRMARRTDPTTPPGGDGHALPREIRADLAALSRLTEQQLPPAMTLPALLSPTHNAAARQRSTPQNTLGDLFMETLRLDPRRTRLRRTLLGALGSFALCSAVLLWPISYERTVGHSVQLTVAVGDHTTSPEAAAQALPPRVLAKQIKTALQADSVRVELSRDEAGTHMTFTARVPQRSRPAVDVRTGALVSELQKQLSASPLAPRLQVQVSERREQVSGRVYAMALDRLIQVRVDTSGKSDAEVKAEVESQLRAQGIASPTVTFERRGDEKQLSIEADTGDRKFQVIRKSHGDDSVVEVTVGDIDTGREPGMTDDQLKDKILRQLTAKGLTGTVTVAGDHIEIRAAHHRAP